MPKERRDRSVSRDGCRASPYPCSSGHKKRSSPKDASEIEENVKEWEDARCPVCMEHPHNAVLLICSSYEKGCRPYMCDTSCRHSNCLDQFRKYFEAENSSTVPQQEEAQNSTAQLSPAEASEPTVTVVPEEITAVGSPTSEITAVGSPTSEISAVGSPTSEITAVGAVGSPTSEISAVGSPTSEITAVGSPVSEIPTSEIPTSEITAVGSPISEITALGSPTSCEHQTPPKLVCPLCRGEIKEWIIVDDARRFMNAKSRSCSCETCNFSGTYTDLRKHARLEHPQVRPSEADPERARNWRRLERQRDLGDLLSTLQSSMGDDRADENIFPSDDGGWLTVFFLIRVFRPGSASRSSSWSGTSRTRAQLSIRRRSTRLRGESYDEETGSSSREEDNESSDDGSSPRRRSERLRRRTTPDNMP